MEQWQPNPVKADQVLSFLMNANLQSDDFRNKVIEYNKDYEFSCYICHVFCHLPNRPELLNCRMLAGIIFKDNIKNYWKSLPDVARQYMMSQIIPTLLSEDEQVQNISANAVLEIYKKVKKWPEMIRFLQEAFQQTDLNFQLAALKIINRLLDDFYDSFANEEDQPLPTLIPMLINSLKTDNQWTRYYALSSMIPLIQYASTPLVQQLENFLTVLFAVAQNPGPERVLVVVCQVFCELVCGNFASVTPHVENIVKFMIGLTSSSIPNIALVASEFWVYLGEMGPKAEVYPLLQQIVPMLFEGLKLTREEIEEMPGLTEDSSPDRSEDVDPSRDHSSMRPLQGVYNRTVRKNCGKAMEEMSLAYETSFIDLVIPLCQVRLASADWRVRETSLLALGATSDVIIKHRADMIPNLIGEFRRLAESDEPLIRYISCWALSRYTAWFADIKEYFELVLHSLVTHIHDKVKKVREQALSALAGVFDRSSTLVTPYTGVLLNELMSIYPFLKSQGLYVIHDTIGSLASAVGSAMVPHIEVFMPKLLANWNVWSDNDPRLTALMDCLSYIALALGENFAVYAEPIFLRCHSICRDVLTELTRKEPENFETTDESFLISALELISNTIAALKNYSAPLVDKIGLANLIIETTRNASYQTLRASFSVIGDLARFHPVHLQNSLSQIVPLLISNIRIGAHYSLLNNTVWAASELVLSFGDLCAPHAVELVNRAVWVLDNDLFYEQIHQNAVLLIAACALSMPDSVTKNLQEFIDRWIYVIEGLSESQQKTLAYLALFKILRIAPTPIQSGWDFFARALISWDYEMKEEAIKQVIQSYQQHVKLWDLMVSNTAYQNAVILFDSVQAS